jgi:DNA-binding XRE family transcriptional regulator
MYKKTTTKTRDAVEILHRRYYQGQPKRKQELARARLNASIAREIYTLRTKAGLTQEQLGRLIGTTGSVISRLEDDNYRGHSLVILLRISQALNRELEVRLVPRSRPKVKA